MYPLKPGVSRGPSGLSGGPGPLGPPHNSTTGYKITFGCVNVTTTEFLMRRSTSTTRGHPYKLYKQHSSCTARSSFFTERVVNIWYSLPADKAFHHFQVLLGRLIGWILLSLEVLAFNFEF